MSIQLGSITLLSTESVAALVKEAGLGPNWSSDVEAKDYEDMRESIVEGVDESSFTFDLDEIVAALGADLDTHDGRNLFISSLKDEIISILPNVTDETLFSSDSDRVICESADAYCDGADWKWAKDNVNWVNQALRETEHADIYDVFARARYDAMTSAGYMVVRDLVSLVDDKIYEILDEEVKEVATHIAQSYGLVVVS